jgi:hypothetical protein
MPLDALRECRLRRHAVFPVPFGVELSGHWLMGWCDEPTFSISCGAKRRYSHSSALAFKRSTSESLSTPASAIASTMGP